jgi:hypothetical protein
MYRPTLPTMSPLMAVMMLTQSATVSPFEVFVRPKSRASHEDRDAGRGEDEPLFPSLLGCPRISL